MQRNAKSPLVLLKNVYFFQAGIGMLANVFLLLFHIFTTHLVHRLRPTDMITCHLAFVHLMMLLITLDILSEDMLRSMNFANELRCKLLLYLSKVMRGLSLSTTCLLSIIQVITISPSSFYLSRFKYKLTKHVAIAFFCILSLNLSSNSYLIIYTVVYSNRTNLLNVNKYCSLSSMNSMIMTLFFILALSQNVFFVGIMLFSSMYMVIFLCRHQRKSEYLHSMSISPRFSPAKRATCTVLLLVSFFVIMYSVDSIISSFAYALWKYEPSALDIQGLLGNIYATVSPLVLISSDKRIIGILQKMIAMLRVWTC
ncbi:putative vomeronasal receptor-like protein 4 [Ochotona princeps]|uniref:putative vomeronasal receptor-like protein 4 n=1 Tax=Ochotona princeps TaxID=9978 RepID=UPI00271474E3|nr:putative vomeronasal receptor-like protein 4 [Ochotona princeps]XP_058512682.1 putative vomeronasal receptor-like protein 4 [Ochotona princeps]